VNALRLLLALAVAASTLLLGASAGGAFTRSVRVATPSGVHPRAAGAIPVGDALEVSGQPMQLSIFYSADPPSRVVRFYADAFLARGLIPVLSRPGGPAHVSAFDPGDGLQRFVSAISQPGGQTLVMTGTVDPRRPAQLLSVAGVSLPLPPERSSLLGFRSQDGEALAQSARFLSALSVGELAAFYRQALAGDGYLERTGGGEGLLLFQKPGASVSVAMQKLSPKRGAAVFVTRIDGDAR
jgi:hypothetical protein